MQEARRSTTSNTPGNTGMVNVPGFRDPVQPIMGWERAMPYRWRDRLSLAAIITLALSAAAATGLFNDDARGAQPTQQTQTGRDTGAPSTAPPILPSATIDGFRGARFGMNQHQVRQAIREEFPGAPIASTVHPSEKTTVLSITVADLLPDTGNARISYILGYRSKTLVQVNLLWISDRSSSVDEALVGAANSLRDYFMSQSYNGDNAIANRQVAENAIIVFRTSDRKGRTILLVLSGTPAGAQPRKEDQPPLTLELAYIEDPAHSDIFRIGKGQF
jgi:hypothetical protein